MKKKKKSNFTNIVLVLILLIGLSLLLYPSVSEYYNSIHATRVINDYANAVEEMTDETYDEIWNTAQTYNETLLNQENYYFSNVQQTAYNSLLNINETGIMGYVEIPSINSKLPVYHGTDESVLSTGIGHLEWSSLPVGGESTHCVISGHRGLPSARLFTDLDKISKGDIFTLTVLGEVLTYEVDQILVVEPEDTSALQIVEGEDYCTLVTCTPYGINTHRLLVRGHRIDNIKDGTIKVTTDVDTIEPLIVAAIVAVPVLLIILIILIVNDCRKKKKNSFGGDVSAKDL